MAAIKVCGITRAEDGRLAWELGAAALGFVFHPASPRAVTVREAALIRAELPVEAVCIGGLCGSQCGGDPGCGGDRWVGSGPVAWPRDA